MDTRIHFNLSRRQWLLQSGIAAAAFAGGPLRAFADSAEGISRTGEAIHQEVIFNATPKRIYDALTDASQFQRVETLSAAVKSLNLGYHPAKIGRQPGWSFSLFGGYITGRQLELVEDKRIVQAWRVGNWDPGIYSVVRIGLSKQGAATKLVLDHAAFPAGAAEHLAAGWYANYWEPLKKFLS